MRRNAATRSRAVIAVFSAAAIALLGIAGPPLVAAADGPTTFTNTTSIAIPATGSADQIGSASPYPSTIAVAGMAGAVSAVTVTFHELTHQILSDVDALLVAPTGANLLVMSDVGAALSLTYATDATLTFSDAASGVVPTGNVPTGSYLPSNNGDGDTFPAPAPTPSGQTTLTGAFGGIDPNGTWSLYIVDDATGDVGTMAGGWSLTITTTVAAVATTTAVTSSSPSSLTGSPVTFTASVTSGGSPVTAGAVQFRDGSLALGAPVPVNGSGTASLTTSTLTEGSHTIRAEYSGAPGFLASNGSLVQRVDNETVVTGMTFCNPGGLTLPQMGTATPYPSNIFVSGFTSPISTVVVTLNGLSHQAPIDFDIMLSGPSPTQNLMLLSDTGGTGPVSSLQLTFDDAAATGVPTPLVSGTFQPTDDNSDGPADLLPAPAPTISSATSLSTFAGSNPNGVWSLWVVDDATGDVGSISGGWCLTFTVPAATSTALSSSANPSTIGDTVTFTATVTSGGSPVNTGMVQFKDGATPLGGPVPVTPDGTASFTTSALDVGSHPISAEYEGTTAYATSTGSVTQVVSKALTSTAVTSSLNPSSNGQTVTFTATVTDSGSPVTTGTVQFQIDSVAVGAPLPLNPVGSATFTTSALTVGSHAISAGYSGTASLAVSSGSMTQIVEALATNTALTSSANPSTVGEAVTFTATVTSSGNPVAAGSVQFKNGSSLLGGPVPLDAAGTATFTTSALAVGIYTITAEYGGAAGYATSFGTLDHVVNPDADAGGPYTVAEGGTLTLDAGASLGGTVFEWDLDNDGQFDDATGVTPSLTWAQLEALGIDDGPSTHPISLRVTAGVLQATDTVQLTVTNTAPVSVLTGALTAVAGQPFTIKVGADDPSSADMAALFSYLVDWGDGSPVVVVIGPADPPVTHTYATAGSFTASFTATDKDGGVGAPTTVTVLAAPAPAPARELQPTGADPAAPLALAGLLLLLGLGLLGRRVRRQS